MSVNTSNAYGKISISDLAIAKVASHTAMECYGIVELVSRRFTDSLAELLKRDAGGRGVKVTIRRIYRRGGGISPRGSQIQSRKLYGYDCGYGKRERHRGKAVESRFAFKSMEAKRFCAVFSAARIFFFNTTD